MTVEKQTIDQVADAIAIGCSQVDQNYIEHLERLRQRHEIDDKARILAQFLAPFQTTKVFKNIVMTKNDSRRFYDDEFTHLLYEIINNLEDEIGRRTGDDTIQQIFSSVHNHSVVTSVVDMFVPMDEDHGVFKGIK